MKTKKDINRNKEKLPIFLKYYEKTGNSIASNNLVEKNNGLDIKIIFTSLSALFVKFIKYFIF